MELQSFKLKNSINQRKRNFSKLMIGEMHLYGYNYCGQKLLFVGKAISDAIWGDRRDRMKRHAPLKRN